MLKWNVSFSLCAVLIVCALTVSCRPRERERSFMDKTGATDAAQPAQPAQGPGGAAYPHADIDMYHYGEGTGELWIFEPADPAPETAPVIIFSHGWAAMYPKMYGGWIRHLVLRGNIVIYQRYQVSMRDRPADMWAASLAAVKAAFAELERPGHVRPDLDRVAAVGHSYGGVMTGNFAAVAAAEGLPKIRAAMSTQPGDNADDNESPRKSPKFPSIMVDYGTIPAETLLICFAGMDDKLVGGTAAKKICHGATAVPEKNKSLILMPSDDHGTPPLVADHFQPLVGDPAFDVANETAPEITRGILALASDKTVDGFNPFAPDALDYNGTWRLFDALCDCAFDGKNCGRALGGAPAVRDMGAWSDGTPVAPLVIEKSSG